jgi:hypothetical protein
MAAALTGAVILLAPSERHRTYVVGVGDAGAESVPAGVESNMLRE